MRIILIILFFFLAYNGYDGLKGDDNLKKLTMSQLIKEGVGDNRYVEISECYSKGDIVYKYSKESPSNIIEVIFPVMDSTSFYNEIFNEFIETEYGDSSNKTKPSTMLIIKRNECEK